jgi:hypothetical protein
VTWAAAPVLLVAVDHGRLGPLVAHVALPWLVWAVVRVVASGGVRAGWTASGAAGLALAVVVCGAPVLLAPAVLLLVAVACTWPRSALPLAWVPLPALAAVGPLLMAAVDEPRVLVSGPSVVGPSPLGDGPTTASDVPAAWELLLGGGAVWPVPGVVGPVHLASALPLVAGGVVLAVALAALGRTGPAAAAVRLGWATAVLGLGTALLLVLTPSAPGAVGWPGPGVSVMTAGLLVAGVTGAEGLRRRMASLSPGRRRAGTGLLAVVALLGPLAVATAWTVDQAAGGSPSSVARGATPVLPEVAVDGAASADRTRTLVLAPVEGGVAASLVRGDGPGLEDISAAATARTVAGDGLTASTVPADAATAAVDDAVAALVAGTVNARPQLSALAAGYVLLLPGDGAEQVAASVDGLPGLERAGSVDGAALWRVEPASGDGRDALDRTARLRVAGPEGAIALPSDPVSADLRLEAGPPGRMLLLSERADGGWWAELDGRRLEPVVHEGWAQAFVLPEGAGTLRLDHHAPGERAWPALAGALLGLSLVLAVPVPAALGRRQAQR